MTKRFDLMDFDKEFKATPPTAVVLNDLPSDTEEERAAIDNLIMTTYNNTDILSSVPSCSCGELTMGFSLGKFCFKCNTPVQRQGESAIDLNVWMRVPDGIDGFINPEVWNVLSELLKTGASGYSILEWMTSAKSRPTGKISVVMRDRLQKLEDMGWPRGLNNFIANFPKFIEILPTLKQGGTWSDTSKSYQRFLRQAYKRNLVFPKYLPMPTKALLVLENTPVGSFADLTITGAVDAARTIVEISKTGTDLTPSGYERNTISVIKGLASYYLETTKLSLASKRGWLRGQLFSSRSHWCGRGVITSIHKPHHYEELHIPWAQGIELLKVHIMAEMEHRGYDARVITELVNNSGNIYIPLLDEIMQLIVSRFSPFDPGSGRPGDVGYRPTLHGIPCIFQRNPSLTRLSAQNHFASIKTNPLDQTFSLSPLVIRGSNADFDKHLCRF